MPEEDAEAVHTPEEDRTAVYRQILHGDSHLLRVAIAQQYGIVLSAISWGLAAPNAEMFDNLSADIAHGLWQLFLNQENAQQRAPQPRARGADPVRPSSERKCWRPTRP